MNPRLTSICLRCPSRGKPVGDGSCFCLFDPAKPIDIRERVESLICPAGKFKLGLGDLVARVLVFTRLNKLAKVKEWITGKPCKCGETQLRWNERFPVARLMFWRRPRGGVADDLRN